MKIKILRDPYDAGFTPTKAERDKEISRNKRKARKSHGRA